jgi:hypothetical protein
MTFQKIVVIIAIISLIGALTFIGYAMYNRQHNVQFPPVSSQCPDYWEAKDNKCYNTKHLGSCATDKNNSVNFNTPFFKGHQGICRKANWAKRCGVSWDGITNNNQQC